MNLVRSHTILNLSTKNWFEKIWKHGKKTELSEKPTHRTVFYEHYQQILKRNDDGTNSQDKKKTKN